MQPILPPVPHLSAHERGWVDTGAFLHPSPALPVWADVVRDPMQGALRRLPWHASVWDTGTGGSAFVPGFVRKHLTFWDEVILDGHPLRDDLISYLRDGVSVYDFLVGSSRGPWRVLPYNVKRFPEAVFANRIPSSHASFVDAEMNSLEERGCVVKWSDVCVSSGRYGRD